MVQYQTLKYFLVIIKSIEDRNIHGGGVFVLVDNSIPSNQVMMDSPCEAVWVQIHTHKHCSMILGSFYCPSHSPVLVWDYLAQCVCQLRQLI